MIARSALQRGAWTVISAAVGVVLWAALCALFITVEMI